MSISKFKFVSPGVQIAEIDNSQAPKTFEKTGPVVIGRAERGPSMRPVRIESFSDYINVFGNPIPGGQGGDIWREGNYTAPTYAAYAVQAYLKTNGPVTMVRLLGTQAGDADGSDASLPGWRTTKSLNSNVSENGGAYGLFLIPSGSASTVTGTLAAVWYVDNGALTLSGNLRGGSVGTEQNAAVLESLTVADISASETVEFKVVVRNSSDALIESITFNFDRDSQKFIRNVFNTNPTLTNPVISSDTKTYWLGETFETNVANLPTDTVYYGIMLGLANGDATKDGGKFKFASRSAGTGWFFSQDLTNDPGSYDIDTMQKLFRIESIDTGEWDQKNLKISVQDIKRSTNTTNPYGLFTIIIRKASDNDSSVQIVERYSNLSLNPNSENYIARRLGDMYLEWDDVERRYRSYGNYSNISKFVRVIMNPDVDAGSTNAKLLPFGVYGPPKYKRFAINGSADGVFDPINFSTVESNSFVSGSNDIVRGHIAGQFVNTGSALPSFASSFEFPSMQLRETSRTDDLPNPKDAYFGLDTTLSNTTRFDRSYLDLTRVRADEVGNVLTGDLTEYSWRFSLDDLAGRGAATPTPSDAQPHASWAVGNRLAGLSITAISGGYESVLNSGWDRFTTPLFGGFSGLDTKEKDPFRNSLTTSASTVRNSYIFNTLKRAIDTVADPEVVEHNLLVLPGITNKAITEHAIEVCKTRGDSMAIIDIENDFLPSTENTDSFVTRVGSVDSAITTLRNRGIDSSYGACYYPWVQIRDTVSANKKMVWVPSSVAALGVLGSSEMAGELWFAPAGFSRGGLSNGASGLTVTNVVQKLTKLDRDRLYEANINPIAKFPSEGIVIYGQKTLQVTPSALDRINVRRMLIYIKKEISKIAATLLFDQNVRRTWNRFLGLSEPFMEGVKARLGVSDFRIQLDTTTTTPELIDRNIMYAKVFVKPAKAIEFIALDFVVSDSGAAFDD